MSGVPQRLQNVRTTGGEDRNEAGSPAENETSLDLNVTHATDGAPRELGDVVICPPCSEDVSEAVLHGALHLTGMDHEVDDGEMLALQAELLRWVQE